MATADEKIFNEWRLVDNMMKEKAVELADSHEDEIQQKRAEYEFWKGQHVAYKKVLDKKLYKDDHYE